MTLFAIFASLLVVVTGAFILPPLWLGLRKPVGQADRQAANLAIFRDQLAELEREQAEGSLAAADFAQAHQELQRRLLSEVDEGSGETTVASHAPTRKTAIAILVLLPVVALVGYGLLGKPAALSPAAQTAQPAMSAEQIDAMVAVLAEKLKANPQDHQGWLMLARSYKALGRYAEAADAFAKAGDLVDANPDLLASYAETIAVANGKGLQGKPTELVEKALKLNPQHGHSLFLAGAAAMERGDNKQGIAYWEALLPQVQPGSEIDRALRDGIAKMKAAGGR